MFINTNPAASTTRYPRQLLDSGFVEGLTALLGPITSIELLARRGLIPQFGSRSYVLEGDETGGVFVAPTSDERRCTSASAAEPSHVMSYNLDLWASSSQKASLPPSSVCHNSCTPSPTLVTLAFTNCEKLPRDCISTQSWYRLSGVPT